MPMLRRADSMTSRQRSGSELVDAIDRRMSILNLARRRQDSVSFRDRIGYWMENWVSANSTAFYQLLLVSTIIVSLVLGAFWSICPQNSAHYTFMDSVFLTFQLLSFGGHDSTITGAGPVAVFIAIVFFGLTIPAVLIGMITESFQEYMHSLGEGRTKAVLADHTLILGWNETTVRVLVQIARLRSVWREQNRTCSRRLFWWRRLPPSTPVASAPVVILADSLSKSQMQEAIHHAFNDHGICRKDNRVGVGIVCRIGDPTAPEDLKRVGAHKARSILSMMTDADAEEAEAGEGGVQNGATLRTLLALRVVMSDAASMNQAGDTRVIAQLASPSKAIEVIDLGDRHDGAPVLQLVDLNQFMRGLLFGCLAQPGLGYALLDLLGFEGAAFRSRAALQCPGAEQMIGKRVKDIPLMWENAIFAGVAGAGLAPPGHYVIQEHDRIIFVSDSSLPEMSAVAAKPADSAGLACIQPAKAARSILISGWRVEWDAPPCFADQLVDVAGDLPAGSQLTFLNMKGGGAQEESDSFVDFMARVSRVCKDSKGGIISKSGLGESQWDLGRGVTMNHISGNAADYETLDMVMQKYTFHQAIVLSSVANKDLSAKLRDTRLMSILVTLRHLQLKHKQPAMHVIGENALDSTGVLALGPTVSRSGDEVVAVPDFVNTHVICGSALVQALAYPDMFPCISEVIQMQDGSANLLMHAAMDVVEAGSYSFRDLSQALRSRHAEDVLLGVRKVSGEMLMAPRLSDVVDVAPGDMLMVLTRRLKHPDHQRSQDLQETLWLDDGDGEASL